MGKRRKNEERNSIIVLRQFILVFEDWLHSGVVPLLTPGAMCVDSNNLQWMSDTLSLVKGAIKCGAPSLSQVCLDRHPIILTKSRNACVNACSRANVHKLHCVNSDNGPQTPSSSSRSSDGFPRTVPTSFVLQYMGAIIVLKRNMASAGPALSQSAHPVCCLVEFAEQTSKQ